MGLFTKKRAVTALGSEALNAIKGELDSVLIIASSYDQMMLRSGALVISLEGRIRGDLLAFLLYLSGIHKGVDQREIDVVNHIFDIDLSHVDFDLFHKDVGTKSFERAIPPSLLILKELGATVQRAQFKTSDGSDSTMPESEADVLSHMLVCDVINLYALIGSAFISANERVTERESGDLVRYLYSITRGIYGPNASLPEGAATRALNAHVRLFGKKPKI